MESWMSDGQIQFQDDSEYRFGMERYSARLQRKVHNQKIEIQRQANEVTRLKQELAEARLGFNQTQAYRDAQFASSRIPNLEKARDMRQEVIEKIREVLKGAEDLT
jgi:predicted Holliday junction resolvase-like endonuclease